MLSSSDVVAAVFDVVEVEVEVEVEVDQAAERCGG
jgi:hypothetical protein